MEGVRERKKGEVKLREKVRKQEKEKVKNNNKEFHQLPTKQEV